MQSLPAQGIFSVSADAHRVMPSIALLYLINFCSFCFGSWSIPRICWLFGATEHKPLAVTHVRLLTSDFTLGLLLCGAFLLSKVLLIPGGYYSNYVFETAAGSSPVWTASMFLSDGMVLASLIVLFSNQSRNWLLFLTVSALNGINLLHGTRNFFVVAVLIATAYFYIRSTISLVKMMFLGAVAFVFVVCLAYGVFLLRSHVVDMSFSLFNILTPVTYESVFSQMSLVSLLNHPILFPTIGNPLHFVSDVLFFSTPRFLLEDKDSALWISQFNYLSPLGAFNGFAAGLLYFGRLVPVFYYCLGLICGLLYRSASSTFGAILYIYFTCDVLYRLTRDGYVIPSKMFINAMEMILCMALFRLLANRYSKGSKQLSQLKKSATC